MGLTSVVNLQIHDLTWWYRTQEGRSAKGFEKLLRFDTNRIIPVTAQRLQPPLFGSLGLRSIALPTARAHSWPRPDRYYRIPRSAPFGAFPAFSSHSSLPDEPNP